MRKRQIDEWRKRNMDGWRRTKSDRQKKRDKRVTNSYKLERER